MSITTIPGGGSGSGSARGRGRLFNKCLIFKNSHHLSINNNFEQFGGGGGGMGGVPPNSINRGSFAPSNSTSSTANILYYGNGNKDNKNDAMATMEDDSLSNDNDNPKPKVNLAKFLLSKLLKSPIANSESEQENVTSQFSNFREEVEVEEEEEEESNSFLMKKEDNNNAFLNNNNNNATIPTKNGFKNNHNNHKSIKSVDFDYVDDINDEDEEEDHHKLSSSFVINNNDDDNEEENTNLYSRFKIQQKQQNSGTLNPTNITQKISHSIKPENQNCRRMPLLSSSSSDEFYYDINDNSDVIEEQQQEQQEEDEIKTLISTKNDDFFNAFHENEESNLKNLNKEFNFNAAANNNHNEQRQNFQPNSNNFQKKKIHSAVFVASGTATPKPPSGIGGYGGIRPPLFAFNNKRPKKLPGSTKKNLKNLKKYTLKPMMYCFNDTTKQQQQEEPKNEIDIENDEDNDETKELKFIARFKRMIATHHQQKESTSLDSDSDNDNVEEISRSGIGFRQLESAQIYYESKSPDDILQPIESLDTMLRTTIKVFQNEESKLLRLYKLRTLTSVQQYIIPNIVNGSVDMLVSAPTGTGKTLAYLMAVVQLICDYRGIGGCAIRYKLTQSHPLALIIVPTHELANQLYQTLKQLIGELPIRLMYFYGSQNLTDQIRKIESGLDIVISTPGRFMHLVEIKQLFFRKFKFIFIDEIDNVLVSNNELKRDLIYTKFFNLLENSNENSDEIDEDDFDFYIGPPEVKQRIQKQFKRPRFFLFSATIDGKIRNQSEHLLSPNYAFIVMGDKVKISNSNIEQIFIPIGDSSSKNVELLKLLEKFYTRYDQILVFVNTIQHADRLTDFLKEKEYQAVSIHSNLTQTVRDQAIADFSNKNVRIAVSTFLLSRGLNLADLRCTIMYDLPQVLADYINCIGRTGRMGNVGISITLFQTYLKPNLALVPELINLLQDSNQTIPQFLLDLQNNPVATYGIDRKRRSK